MGSKIANLGFKFFTFFFSKNSMQIILLCFIPTFAYAQRYSGPCQLDFDYSLASHLCMYTYLIPEKDFPPHYSQFASQAVKNRSIYRLLFCKSKFFEYEYYNKYGLISNVLRDSDTHKDNSAILREDYFYSNKARTIVVLKTTRKDTIINKYYYSYTLHLDSMYAKYQNDEYWVYYYYDSLNRIVKYIEKSVQLNSKFEHNISYLQSDYYSQFKDYIFDREAFETIDKKDWSDYESDFMDKTRPDNLLYNSVKSNYLSQKITIVTSDNGIREEYIIANNAIYTRLTGLVMPENQDVQIRKTCYIFDGKHNILKNYSRTYETRPTNSNSMLYKMYERENGFRLDNTWHGRVNSYYFGDNSDFESSIVYCIKTSTKFKYIYKTLINK